MIKSNALLFIILLLSFFGCSRQYHIAKIIPGNTTLEEALNHLDDPQLARTSQFDSSTHYYVWEDVSLQIKNKVVHSIHRTPASHEKHLQFWKQYYKNQDTRFSQIPSTSPDERLWQFDIPSKGINVIYDENNDQVTRVIFYAVE